MKQYVPMRSILLALALAGCADLIGSEFGTYRVHENDAGAGGASSPEASAPVHAGGQGGELGAGGASSSGGARTSTGGELGAGGDTTDAGNPYGTTDRNICNGPATNCILLQSCVLYPTTMKPCCRADHRCGCEQVGTGACNLF